MNEVWGTILVTACKEPPPETDNFKFGGTYSDLNPPHHHDNSSSQPPTSFLNSLVFLDDTSVSPIQISQHCSSSEKGTNLYCIFLSSVFLS